jgi:hypothetical protein
MSENPDQVPQIDNWLNIMFPVDIDEIFEVFRSDIIIFLLEIRKWFCYWFKPSFIDGHHE